MRVVGPDVLLFFAMLVWLPGCAEPDTDPPVNVAPALSSESESGNDTDRDASKADVATAEKPKFVKRRSINEIINSLGNGVVQITARDVLGLEIGKGSGFVVRADGLIATNFHVLRQAASATVTFRDGRERDVLGTVVIHAERDLALIKIKPEKKLDVFEIAPKSQPRQGDEVIAIGHPAGFEFTVSTGIVSAIRTNEELPEVYRNSLATAKDTDWLQTSAAISVGSSGGPLLDVAGNVIGVTTWIASGENLGFAVNSRHLQELLDISPNTIEPLPIRGTGWITDSEVASIVASATLSHDTLIGELEGLFDFEDANRVFLKETRLPEFIKQLEKRFESAENAVEEIEALTGILLVARDFSPRSRRSFRSALERLRESHLEHPHLIEVCSIMSRSTRIVVAEFLNDVLKKSPHRDVQSAACRSLYIVLTKLDVSNQRYASLRSHLLKRLSGDLAEVRVAGSPGHSFDNGHHLIQLDTLGVGCTPPNIAGQGADGKPLQLKDHRGRVVVLDFWTDRVPQCREMYPLKKAMMKRYAKQPFSLLGVNMDDATTLKRLTSGGTVPGRHWNDGIEGPIAKKWHVTHVPHTYFLDPAGRVIAMIVGQSSEMTLRFVTEQLFLETSQALPLDVIPRGVRWRYRSAVEAPGDTWSSINFDDSGWKTGMAPLGFGSNGLQTNLPAKPVTHYFRHRFEIEKLDDINDLILQAYYDDGIVVFVNGVEIARRGLTESASHDTQATEPDLTRGIDPSYFAVPVKVLRQGVNVVAVELHQSRLGRADLRFELGAGRNWIPKIKTLLDREDVPFLGGLFRVAWYLGPAAAELKPALEKWIATDNLHDVLYATTALASISPTSRPEAPSRDLDEDELDQRMDIALTTGRIHWNNIRNPKLSRQDYAHHFALVDAVDQISPGIEELRQYRAWGLARMGLYDEAMRVVRGGSLIRFSYEPWELACQVYLHRKLGNHKQADSTMQKLDAAVATPKYLFNIDLHELADEVRAMKE